MEDEQYTATIGYLEDIRDLSSGIYKIAEICIK